MKMADSVENNETPVASTETKTDATADTRKPAGRKQELVGIVSSNKMMKSVVVKVDRMVRHEKYKKIIRRTSKFMAHNDLDDVNIGDKVKIESTRPLSARKRWRVIEVVQRAAR